MKCQETFKALHCDVEHPPTPEAVLINEHFLVGHEGAGVWMCAQETERLCDICHQAMCDEHLEYHLATCHRWNIKRRELG